jgi:hypothetical protein
MWLLALVCPAVVGGLLLAAAYRLATVADAPAAYGFFWCGLLIGAIPSVVVLIRDSSRAMRVAAVFVLGVITYLPKVMRDPGGPALYDEVLHYGQVLKMSSTGSVSVPNTLVPVLQYYPGGDAAVIGLHLMTGLPLWDAGLVFVGLAHVALLFGVFALARVVTRSAKLAGLAAVIYAASPGFTFFTTQVAYESVALPLAVWTVVAAVHAIGAQGGRRTWLLMAATGGAAAVGVTHHATGLLLSGLLLVLAIGHVVYRRDAAAGTRPYAWLFGLAAFSIAFDLLWIELRDPHILAYISPNPSDTLRAAGDLFSRSGQGHTAFAASLLPGYEQVSAFITAPLVALLVLVGLFGYRAIGPNRALRYTMLAVAVGFPLSLPLEFSNTGLVWAHRLWPYLYVGVAIVAAVAVVRLIEGFPLPGRQRWHLVSRHPAAAAVAVLFAVVLVGDTATDVNAQTQFPDIPVYAGAEALNSSASQRLVAWFATNTPVETRFVAEPDIAVELVSYTDAQAVPSFPTWLLTESVSPVGEDVLAQLATDRITYLVVDTRMYAQKPMRGYVYEPYEPRAFIVHPPVSLKAWEALQHQPWATQVFVAGSLVVFRLSPGAAASNAVGSK